MHINRTLLLGKLNFGLHINFSYVKQFMLILRASHQGWRLFLASYYLHIQICRCEYFSYPILRKIFYLVRFAILKVASAVNGSLTHYYQNNCKNTGFLFSFPVFSKESSPEQIILFIFILHIFITPDSLSLRIKR